MSMSENKRRAEIIKRQNEAAKKIEISSRSKIDGIKDSLKKWRKDFIHVKLFLKRSTKPNKSEYLQLLRAHGTGVILLGMLGYIITFIHIPINNILFSSK
ncbi:protein transport protein SEC61 subunit gamma [Nematocida sp. LUAm3]|nr:protein transport protein SEC61 subunit gamma [Nematocida sp. LUAm3]KAI5174912.1 protein transport protein SEC61 subunit gamma [Nematocida sp. LUAm2]KAI5177490.1 protein transport protein SEC61 subunit gamma [Nematocida sp. LUAm1]